MENTCPKLLANSWLETTYYLNWLVLLGVCTAALALCYSVAEYCAPVWARYSHTNRVDTQLNSSMRIITGTVHHCPLPWLSILSNIEPAELRRRASTDKLVAKALSHPQWGLHQDLTCHTPQRLKSRHPLWEDVVQIDTMARWKEDWRSANVVNSTLVEDPAIRQPGFLLLRHLWSLLNRFCTGQGTLKAYLKNGFCYAVICE